MRDARRRCSRSDCSLFWAASLRPHDSRLRTRPPSGRGSAPRHPAAAERGDRERSREAGFDHHLVKPADFDALLKILETVPAMTA